MLVNIKSSYILKKLFTFINDKRKLQLIKKNKKIKELIDINIINYRLFSGKYIIFETKGKGNEYNSLNDKLIYEGEFLDGIKNGKGKEYNKDGILIYEGKYLNGERNGKGKEYYKDELIFEGEYLDGKEMEK